MNYIFYHDPGHGWLRVPKQEIENKKWLISPCSYMDESFVYLEEDSDMSIFIEAKGITNFEEWWKAQVQMQYSGLPRSKSFYISSTAPRYIYTPCNAEAHTTGLRVLLPDNKYALLYHQL